MRFSKVFIVGPHDKARYELIRQFIEDEIKARSGSDDLDITIFAPTDNPNSDRFNDWIFAQIDTCDLLIADMTGFNPNVVYEVAFAHALGTPCGYIRFSDDETNEATLEDIRHYFKFTLMPATTEADLRAGDYPHLSSQIGNFLQGSGISGETILSDYYGASPIDSEFMRGLAEGYYRNFLGRLLSLSPPEDNPRLILRISLPDTFVITDAELRRVRINAFGDEQLGLGANKLGRPFTVDLAVRDGETFVLDIPTTILTVTLSSKYRKIIRTNAYFSDIDRDRLTDRLARKFAGALWDIIREKQDQIEWPLDQFEIVWLSELVGQWHENEALMNAVPIPRPDGI